MPQLEIAIIGAGPAGLTCARILQEAGYSVLVLDKSRGVGGRVATRRLQETCADHGLRYLEPQGKRVQQLIETLSARGVLQVWTETLWESGATDSEEGDTSSTLPLISHCQTCYVAPAGMNSMGKFLAEGLEIWRNCRVLTILPTDQDVWQLTLEIDNPQTPTEITAKAVVVATPAPQAAAILNEAGIKPDLLSQIQAVAYDPCIAVMAGFPAERQADLIHLNPFPKAISFPKSSDLDWVGLESSKRTPSQQPVFVVHSSAAFAEKYLETPNLQQAGRELLDRVANHFIPWLNAPEWMQVHRWRYAFCRNPLPTPCLTTTHPLPLVGAGDWCGSNRLEGALESGVAAGDWLCQHLSSPSL